MIGQLTGVVSHKEERFLILNVNGVGYKVFATPDTLSRLIAGEAEYSIWTHLVVREDVLDLYGFIEKQELDFFELLITVSGIGPKSALAILSLAGTETLQKSILSGNTDYLTKVSGIGRKSAEKIVLELKDKLGNIGTLATKEELDEESELLQALQALGYSTKESVEAIKRLPKDSDLDIGEKIRLALKNLEKPRR